MYDPVRRNNFVEEKKMPVSGCGGSTNGDKDIFGRSSSLTQILNPRMASNEDEHGSLEFECPKCHEQVKRPQGKLIDKCPKCGGDVRC